MSTDSSSPPTIPDFAEAWQGFAAHVLANCPAESLPIFRQTFYAGALVVLRAQANAGAILEAAVARGGEPGEDPAFVESVKAVGQLTEHVVATMTLEYQKASARLGGRPQ